MEEGGAKKAFHYPARQEGRKEDGREAGVFWQLLGQARGQVGGVWFEASPVRMGSRFVAVAARNFLPRFSRRYQR